jgi:hypothetical protein
MTDTPSPLIQPAEPAEQRAARLAAQGRADRRWMRRRLSVYIGGCVGSCAAGLALMALGLHSGDQIVGSSLFWSGLLVGDLGVFASLWHWYRSSDEAV